MSNKQNKKQMTKANANVKKKRNKNNINNRNRDQGKNNPNRSILSGHVTAACSILNPFCVAAKGAPRPDGLGHGSIPFQVRGSLLMSTDANGNSFLAIVPGLGRFGYATGVIAASNITVGAAWALLNGSNFINTNASEVRIVSLGVKAQSIASMTDCKGLVHFFTRGQLVNSDVIPQLSQNNIEDQVMPLTAGNETILVSKPMGITAHSFRPYSDASSTMSNFDWTTLCIEIAGGAASVPVMYVEVIVNVEITLNNLGVSTTGLGGVLRPARPANPIALQAQAAVQNKTSSIVLGGYDKLESYITNAATTAVSSFWNSASDFGLALLGL